MKASYIFLSLLGSSMAAVPVSQIGDGQIQATTYTDESATTLQAVSQIGDGQIQATTSTASASAAATTLQAISQISDGQIQATTSTLSTVNAVSQISDGQIQATTDGARTISTLIGSQYYSDVGKSSASLSGDLSGSLITLTTVNANGVAVTIVASATVTGTAGEVSIGTARGSSTVVETSNGVVITELVNGGNNLQVNLDKTLILGSLFTVGVFFNAWLM